MRDRLRQWLVDKPRTLDAAYGLILIGSFLLEAGTHAGAGGGTGP